MTSLRSPRAPLPGGPGSVFTSPWSPSPPKATLLMDRRWCLVTGLFLSLAASLRALSLTCQAFGLTLFEFTTSVRLSSGCSVAQSGPALCNPTDYRVSLSFTMSRSLLKLTIIESGMPSNHLVLCHPLLLLPQSFPASGVFLMSWLFALGGRSIEASEFSDLI